MDGYYNETIYVKVVQANCPGDYYTQALKAIENWNATVNGYSISPRNIKKNEVSSSEIIAVSFSSSAALDDNTSHGTYISYSSSLSECTCHTSSAFFIYVNTDKENVNEDDDMSNSDVKLSVITHELGHALGLGHSTDTSHIMYTKRDRDKVKEPTDSERYRVVQLWNVNH